jgi:DeoR family transcriptional regulator, fructose operon transcriptional repressor
MFAEERRIQIIDLLNERRKVTVDQLCEVFGVSSATIRMDLRELQRIGALTRTHGGAILRMKTGFELNSEQRVIQHLAEKQQIARAALALIDDGDRIVLDTGTTSLELAKLVHEKANLTVITNDIEIAGILEEVESTQVIVMGGILRKRFHCTIVLQGRETYSGLTVDKAFIGVNSLSLEKGATTPDLGQAETKKALISMANRVILLCDSSKIGTVSFAQFATIDQIDVVITDKIDRELKSAFEEKGVEIMVADS